VALALSLGTGTPFLGEFPVPRRVRVAMLSGESGQAVLQETARRVANAKGINLAEADVLWEFQLPQLADVTHLAARQEALQEAEVKVAIIDPLYLCLAGVAGDSVQASNLYQMGPLLLGAAKACLSIGCTPILAHHFKLTRSDPYGEPQLEDLAFSGIQELARQWILLGRRVKYLPGTGSHKLLLSVGGSAGHSGLWSLDIEEGVVGEDFGGRKWEVEVRTVSEAKESEKTQKEAAKAQDLVTDQPDSLERFTLTFRALPSEIPARIRVRRFLKVALRAFGLVNEGFVDGPQDAPGARQGEPAGRDRGPGWRPAPSRGGPVLGRLPLGPARGALG
jgi:hypothetical protein